MPRAIKVPAKNNGSVNGSPIANANNAPKKGAMEK
jgi:hypothetical protein